MICEYMRWFSTFRFLIKYKSKKNSKNYNNRGAATKNWMPFTFIWNDNQVLVLLEIFLVFIVILFGYGFKWLYHLNVSVYCACIYTTYIYIIKAKFDIWNKEEKCGVCRWKIFLMLENMIRLFKRMRRFENVVFVGSHKWFHRHRNVWLNFVKCQLRGNDDLTFYYICLFLAYWTFFFCYSDNLLS